MTSRTIQAIGLLVAAAMCLFPPFQVTVPKTNYQVFMGYHCLFLEQESPAYEVDIGRLGVQLLLVLVVTGAVKSLTAKPSAGISNTTGGR